MYNVGIDFMYVRCQYMYIYTSDWCFIFDPSRGSKEGREGREGPITIRHPARTSWPLLALHGGVVDILAYPQPRKNKNKIETRLGLYVYG